MLGEQLLSIWLEKDVFEQVGFCLKGACFYYRGYNIVIYCCGYNIVIYICKNIENKMANFCNWNYYTPISEGAMIK